MTFPLEWLRRSFSRGEVRLWLPVGREADAFSRRVRVACRYLDSLIGQPRAALADDAFEQIFGDYRIGRATLDCLLEQYRSVTPAWVDLVGPVAAATLAAHGIHSPSDLRLALFQRLAADGGFVRRDERDPFLARWAGELGLPDALARRLVDWLWCDGETAAVFQPPPAPVDPAAIARRFVRRAVAGLLAHGREVRLTLPDGRAWRRAYFLCRQAGLYAEPVWPSDLVIAGPPTAIRSADLGERLATTTLALVAAGATGFAQVLLYGRTYRFVLSAEIARALGPLEEQPTTFDSDVEAAFYRRFVGLMRIGRSRGWTIKREPEALQTGEGVLLPDFGLTRSDRTVFVEILGHWTAEYRERKRARLLALARRGALPLLLIVAEPLLASFADLPFPIVPYRGRIDVEALLDALDRFFPEPDRLHRLARAAIQRACQTDRWIGYDQLGAALAATSAEIEQAIASAALPPGLVHVPGLGICRQTFLDQVAACLDRVVAAGGTPAVDVAAALMRACGYDGPLPALIAAFAGFRLVWADLFSATVVRAATAREVELDA